MKYTSFYFIRHGQTDWNLQKRAMGQFDIPLNATGLAQAEQAAELLKTVEFVSIAVSPLVRAVKTAEIIAEKITQVKNISGQVPTNISIQIIDEFKECSWGDVPQMPEGWVKDWHNHVHIEGLEPWAQLVQRVKIGLDKAFELSGPVLIVAHGGVYWAIQDLLSLPVIEIANCVPVYHRSPMVATESWLVRNLER
ncbi:MAG: histidine phosphatase family protein [bacterium]